MGIFGISQTADPLDRDGKERGQPARHAVDHIAFQGAVMAKNTLTTDFVALSVGSILLASLAWTMAALGAAGHDPLWAQHLVQGMVGTSLLLWPVLRLVIRRMFNPGDVVEFAAFAGSLRKVGLSRRVSLINLYLAEQADDAWRQIYGSDQDLWACLGDAYQDAGLRAQMDPKVALRVAAAGYRQGALAGAA